MKLKGRGVGIMSKKMMVSNEEIIKKIRKENGLEVTKKLNVYSSYSTNVVLDLMEKARQEGIKEGHRIAGAEYFKQVTDGKIKLEIVNENDPYWDEAKCALKPLFKLIKEYVTTGTIKE